MVFKNAIFKITSNHQKALNFAQCSRQYQYSDRNTEYSFAIYRCHHTRHIYFKNHIAFKCHLYIKVARILKRSSRGAVKYIRVSVNCSIFRNLESKGKYRVPPYLFFLTSLFQFKTSSLLTE